jgi:paraquat-inducible protein B
MSSDVRYFRVGLFVLVGLAAVVGLAVALGGGGWLDESATFETYFEESVQGLDVGSPVKLRGVPLGQVSEIGLVADYYPLTPEERARHGQKVLVRMQIELERGSAELRATYLPELIASGLRVRISGSVLMGTAYIEAEVVRDAAEPAFAITWDPAYPYIPSKPSKLEELSTAAERALERLDELDVERTLTNLNALLVALRDRMSEVDVAGTQGDVRALLSELRVTNRELQRAIASEDLAAFGAGAREAVERLNGALAQLPGMVEGGRYELGVALDNLRVASENLREFSETARSYPSFMILGEPPQRGPVPPR